MRTKKVCFFLAVLLIAGSISAYAGGGVETAQDVLDIIRDASQGASGGGTTNSGATLNGAWQVGIGTIITIDGSTGVFTQIVGSGRLQDAVNKGFISVGSQYFRNLRKTGDLTWSGQELSIIRETSTPDIAAGVDYINTTITLSADGQSFQSSSAFFSNSFTRK